MSLVQEVGVKDFNDMFDPRKSWLKAMEPLRDYQKTLSAQAMEASALQRLQEKALASLSGTANAFDISNLVSRANFGSAAYAATMLEGMTRPTIDPRNWADQFSRLLDTSSLAKPIIDLGSPADAFGIMKSIAATFQRESSTPYAAALGQALIDKTSAEVLGKPLADIQHEIESWRHLGSLTTQLGRLGLGTYSDKMFEVFRQLDFSTIRETALAAAEHMAHELDDEPLSSESLESAIESAPLEAIQEAIRAAVAEAMEKSHGPAAFRNAFMLSLFWFVLGVILEPFADDIYQRLMYPKKALENDEAPARVKNQPRPSGFRERLVIVKSTALHLRAGPSTTQRLVTTVAKGQVLRILSRKRAWGRVAYVDPLATGVLYTGWVKLRYTRTLEDETARLLWPILSAMDLNGDDLE
jgi:hypothetical protein